MAHFLGETNMGHAEQIIFCHVTDYFQCDSNNANITGINFGGLDINGTITSHKVLKH